MFRLNRNIGIFICLSFVVLITYLLFSLSNVHYTPRMNLNDSKAILKGSLEQIRPIPNSDQATIQRLNLQINRNIFNDILSQQVKNLISKDNNPDIYKYIDVKYEQHHFVDFSKMAEEMRMLQRFWMINRQLTEVAIANGKNTSQADVKHYIFNLLMSDAELSVYLNDLETFYFLMGRLEQKLVGWIHPHSSDLSSLYDTFKPGSKAIVMGVFNRYMSLAANTIRAIREVHKCDIPIHIYYIGEDDLKFKYRQILQNLAKDIYLHDITTLLDNRIIELSGWAVKPFAALLAPAEEVMLMDADTVFIQSPDHIFKRSDYLKKKSLFFFDRAIGMNNPNDANWVLSFAMNDKEFEEINPDFEYDTPKQKNHKTNDAIIPRRLEKSRYINLETPFEQEAGLVLINKRERFIPLLATCNMNNKQERDEVSYKKFWGDKETFWMGFEMVGGQYAWNPYSPGMISDGTFEPTEIVPDLPNLPHNHKWQGTHVLCGSQMVHIDDELKPIWFNGGVYSNKHKPEWGLGVFSHFIYGQKYRWSLKDFGWACMYSYDGEVLPVGEKASKTLKDTEDILIQLKEQYKLD